MEVTYDADVDIPSIVLDVRPAKESDLRRASSQ